MAARIASCASVSLVERLAEVALGGRLHAVALVAVEVLVEVGGDDLLLAFLARIGLGQPDRLDDLARLALIGRARERLGREQPRADELLGDRGGAAGPAGQGIEARRDDADRVEPGVDPEVLVLDGRRGVDDLARQLVEGDQLALEVAEAGELDLAGPVVDDRLLLERDVRERGRRVGETRGVLVVRGHREERSAGRRPGQRCRSMTSRTTTTIRPSMFPERALRSTSGAPVGGADAARGWSA